MNSTYISSDITNDRLYGHTAMNNRTINQNNDRLINQHGHTAMNNRAINQYDYTTLNRSPVMTSTYVSSSTYVSNTIGVTGSLGPCGPDEKWINKYNCKRYAELLSNIYPNNILLNITSFKLMDGYTSPNGKNMYIITMLVNNMPKTLYMYDFEIENKNKIYTSNVIQNNIYKNMNKMADIKILTNDKY